MSFRQTGGQRVLSILNLILAFSGFVALVSLGFLIPGAVALILALALFLRTLWPVCVASDEFLAVRNVRTRSFSPTEIACISRRDSLVYAVATLELVDGESHPVWAIQRDKARGDLSVERFARKQRELADILSVPVGLPHV